MKKYRQVIRFNKHLWTLKLKDLNYFIQKNMDNLDPLQIEGFHILLMGLYEFFEEESITSINNNH